MWIDVKLIRYTDVIECLYPLVWLLPGGAALGCGFALSHINGIQQQIQKYISHLQQPFFFVCLLRDFDGGEETGTNLVVIKVTQSTVNYVCI